MKISKQQLQKIIQEELAIMQEEGELEEGFLDKLIGKGDSSFTGFITDKDVKSKVDGVQTALGKLHNVASKQENRPLTDLVTLVSDKVGQMYNMLEPKGAARIAPEMALTYKNTADDLKKNPLSKNNISGKKRLIQYTYRMKNDGKEPDQTYVNSTLEKSNKDPNGYEKLKKDFFKAYEDTVARPELFTGAQKDKKLAGRTGLGGFVSKFE